MAVPTALAIPTAVPSIANINNHVKLELTYINYYNWQRLFSNFLKSHGMTLFLTADTPAVTHPQYSLWVQMDATVLGWITSTLSIPVLEAFLNYNCESARSAWQMLEKLFLDHAATTQMHLYRRFQNFTLGNLSMEDMLTQLHSLSCHLNSVGKHISDEDLVRQALYALPSAYSAFLTVMNAKGKYPNFSKLRSMLLSEEDRVKSLESIQPSLHSSSALYADKPSFMHTSQNAYKSSGSNNSWRGRQRSYPSAQHKKGSYTPNPAVSSDQPVKSGSKDRCQICNKYNHVATTCRKRFDHGFVSPQLPQSFAAMKIDNDDELVTFYPDSGASSHMTGQTDSDSTPQLQ